MSVESGDIGGRKALWALLVWALAGASSLAYFVATYDRALPDASISLEVNRQEAIDIARSFIEERGYGVEGYLHRIYFTGDDQGATFLEKTLPLEEANRLMRDEVSTWYWRTVWIGDEDQDDYAVYIAPGGKVVGFDRYTRNDTPGGHLSPEHAEALAKGFLRDVAGFDLSAWSLTYTEETEQSDRTDYAFRWTRDDFDIEDALYDAYVSMQGHTVGEFREYLRVPEAWDRIESDKEADRALFHRIADIFRMALLVVAGAVFVQAFWKKEVRWRFALALGLTVAALELAQFVNTLQYRLDGHDWDASFALFLMQTGLASLAEFVMTVFGVLAVALPAESLARRVFPKHISISHMFSADFWIARPVVSAIFVGLCLAMLHAGFLTAFYLLGKPFGIWSPQYPPDLNSVATPFPWIYPLTTGVTAAIREELLFRLFAIALIFRLTRQRWLAVLAPAVVWAFLHSTYPQDPAWARGIELTIVGVVYGVVFLRYGIIATIVSHYTYNALLGSMVLLRSDATYLQLSGLIVVGLMVLPMVPALLHRAGGGSLVDAHTLDVPHEPWRLRWLSGPPELPHQARVYRLFVPLTSPRLRKLGLAALLAIVAWPLFWPRDIAREIPIKINRYEARQLADAFLREQGVDVDTFRSSVSFHDHLEDEPLDYLYQEGGREAVLDHLGEAAGTYLHWSVYYFVPGEVETHSVYVAPDGSIARWYPEIAETTEGALLSQEAAKKLAAQTLKYKWQIDVEGMEIVEARSIDYANRRDHAFTWEAAEVMAGDAVIQYSLHVQGDRPVAFGRTLKPPKEWSNQRDAMDDDILFTALMIVAMAIGFAIAVYLAVWAAILFVQRAIDWRVIVLVSVPMLITGVVVELNNLSLLWENYDNSTSALGYLAGYALEAVVQTLFWAFILGVVAAYADGLYRYSVPRARPLMAWVSRGQAIRSGVPLGRAWAEAILTGLAIALILGVLLDGMPDFGRVPPGERNVLLEAPIGIVHGGWSEYVPALALFGEAVEMAILAGIGLLIAVCVYRRVLGGRLWPLVMIGLVGALGQTAIGDWDAPMLVFLVEAVRVVCALGVTILLVKRVARDNLLAYGFAILFYELLGVGFGQLHAANPYEWANGTAPFIAVALLAALGVMLLSQNPAKPPFLPAPPVTEDVV
jgi:hypothetical protein